MDKYTWSYSSISLFQQCPRKYHRLRVVKDIVEPPQQHLIYGTDVHEAAENYVCKSIDLPAKYSAFKNILDTLKKIPGEKYCEYEMGLTKDLEPCAFKASDVWFRGIADLLVIDGDSAHIIDYKTGKSSQYADTKQLELLSRRNNILFTVRTYTKPQKITYAKALICQLNTQRLKTYLIH
jgi:ATP-dependent exoDNAse (exonuclease V) beta subunit